MKSWFWKGLGVFLILYSIIVGLLTPLKPGIVGTDRLSAKELSNIQLTIETYNFGQHLTDGAINAYLKVDTPLQIISAGRVEQLELNQFIASFDIPQIDFLEKSVVDADVILTHTEGGYAYLPGGLFIKKDTASRADEIQINQKDKMSVSDVEGLYFPFRNILLETIKNTYYHIPLWFAMIIMFALSAWYSYQYLRKKDLMVDFKAQAYSEVGLLLGILGLVTGAIWANYTWGEPWSWDIKQITSAVALLIYLAYFILRSSTNDLNKKARLTAAYNIFAFVMIIPLLFIIPRMTDSLHPGNGGNPAMGGEDLDNTMRLIFYPAIIGWILFSAWIAQIKNRILKLRYKNVYNVDV